jgi:hypothetical protein
MAPMIRLFVFHKRFEEKVPEENTPEHSVK